MRHMTLCVLAGSLMLEMRHEATNYCGYQFIVVRISVECLPMTTTPLS